MKIIKTSKYIKKTARVKKWDNTPGEVYIELAIGEENNLYDATNDKDISDSLELEIIKFLALDIHLIISNSFFI